MLKRNKYVGILSIAVTTLQYITISMITIFSMYIAHVRSGSGRNSYQGHVNDSGEFWRVLGCTSITTQALYKVRDYLHCCALCCATFMTFSSLISTIPLAWQRLTLASGSLYPSILALLLHWNLLSCQMSPQSSPQSSLLSSSVTTKSDPSSSHPFLFSAR